MGPPFCLGCQCYPPPPLRLAWADHGPTWANDQRVTIYLIRDKAMLLLTDRSVIRQRLIPPSRAASFICFIRVDYVQPDYVQAYVFPYSQCIQSQCRSGLNCLFAAITEALNHCSMPYCLPYCLMTWSDLFSFFFFMLELMVLFN